MPTSNHKPLAPPPVAGPMGTLRTLIGKPLVWLTSALQLTTPQVPTALSTDPVAPVIDVLQDGWTLASWRTFDLTVNVAGGSQVICPVSADTQVICYGDVHVPAPPITVARNVWIELRSMVAPGALQVVVAHAIAQPVVSPVFAFVVAWNEWTGQAGALIVVPPGYQATFLTDIAGGETLGATFIVATIPGQQRAR